MKITQTKNGWLVEPETVSEKAHLRYLLTALAAHAPQGTLLTDSGPSHAAAPASRAEAPAHESLAHGSSPYWFLRIVRGVVAFFLIGRIAETLNFQRYQHMNQTDAMAGFIIGFVAVAILSLLFWGLKSLIDFLHIRKHGRPHPGLTKWWNL